ncbi:ankryin [Pyxidicoccus fallax]|uniref:Ankryin n=1 Tax=Pyxidicoccus fallax TaxID=394095 RepID=A0A848LGA6_9BACT|nr:ankryin [Pyxidicoccus fallax]NMO15571.1 ankryin [Pyxidicoccus fallax]NPC81060.1 ankryin [Pyxidicoccus fallax]
MSTTPNPEATRALLSLCENRARWPSELAPDAVRKLLAEGADVHGRGRYGSTPLHFAVLAPDSESDPRPNLDVVRVLLEAGADPNARDDHAQTPLLRAVPSNSDERYEAHALELIHLLRAAGARVPDDVRGRNAGAFRMGGTPRIYTELLDAGARIDVRDDEGGTPLHQTVDFWDAPLAELLLARGADVNALDGLGRTPLGLALRTRQERVDWGMESIHDPGLSDLNAVIDVLERAGGKPRVPYAWNEADPFGPFPVDSAALRAAVPEDGFPFEHDVESAQEFITGLRSDGTPSRPLALLAALRDTLGTPPRHLRLKGPLTLNGPFFHHGDLEVDGHLDIRRPFAVTGNLIVHGVLDDNGNDSPVHVLGDVRCHALFSSGDFNVKGDIHARDIVMGYYNDHSLSADTIHARVVISVDHDIMADVKAEHEFGDRIRPRDGEDSVAKRLRALFVPEVFREEAPGNEDEDEALYDEHDLFDRLRKGLPVFRERP